MSLFLSVLSCLSSSQLVVVDCRGHLLGRLASTVAKELLAGQHIVLVRCEEINVSGNREFLLPISSLSF